MACTVYEATITEDGTAVLLARICAASGSTSGIVGEGYPIVQADVSTITYSVFDTTNDDAVIINASALTVSAVIFNTLQDTAGYVWTVDSVGYNFKHTIGATAFPTGGHVYRYEAKFTMASGDVLWVLADFTAEAILTS